MLSASKDVLWASIQSGANMNVSSYVTDFAQKVPEPTH